MNVDEIQLCFSTGISYNDKNSKREDAAAPELIVYNPLSTGRTCSIVLQVTPELD
jgi:hypothetical protein